MKRILSVLLCFVLAAVTVIPAFAVYTDVGELSEYPVVLVPGYSSSDLVMTDDDGNVTKIWDLDFSQIGEMVEQEYLSLLVGGAKLTQGDYEYLGRFLGEAVLEIFEYMMCNPDGTSKYNVTTLIENTAEACRWSNIAEEYRDETELMATVAEYVSEDMIYELNCDFRMGATDNALELRKLILDIVETTGCEKVNILCISHGGQVTGTYLSLFAEDSYVNNCVMCMPAMGGASLAYDIAIQNVVLDENMIVQFLEHGYNTEIDFHWLTTAESLGFLDDLLAEFVPYVCQLLYTWSSIWDFIPYEYLDEVIDFVDSDYYAGVIEKTTVFHEEIMANYGTNLKLAQDSGVNITIISGSGIPAVTGSQENTDALIRVTDTSGATCAPYGLRFSDGYQTLNTTCDDPSHNHLSPSMEIDASTAWLPENTWYVDGLYHGMERHDDYSFRLTLIQLLSANPIADVHSDSEFPQFHTTTNNSSSVHAQFDVSTEGYLSSDDNYIVVTNITTDSTIDIYDISFQGIDLEVTDFTVKTVKAGESVKIKIKGDVPEVSRVRCAVTVCYIAYGSVTPVGIQTFDFTIMNGDSVEYDASNPYTDVDFSVADENTPDAVKSSPYQRLIVAINKLIEFFVKFYENFMSIFE